MKTIGAVTGTFSSIGFKKGFVFVLLFSLTFLSKGQLIKENDLFSFENNEVSEYELTSFKCKYVEGKVYIMFSVLEPSNDCFYILEKSTNDKIYKTIHVVKGTKSPGNNRLLNSFVDNESLNSTAYYRIKRLTKQGWTTSSINVVSVPEIMAEEIQVVNNNEGFAWAKNQ